MSHTVEEEALLEPSYDTWFLLQRGCCCQGKDVIPVDHIKGKGFQSRLTFGLKIRLTAGIEPCLLIKTIT